jgi:hypothetical protein
MLFGDIPLPPDQPVHLASSGLPLVAQNGLKLGPGQPGGQPPTDELETRLGGFGSSGSLRGGVLLEHCNGQDAIYSSMRGHFGLPCGGIGCSIGAVRRAWL